MSSRLSRDSFVTAEYRASREVSERSLLKKEALGTQVSEWRQYVETLRPNVGLTYLHTWIPKEMATPLNPKP